jgi:hypothetical protein
MLKQLAQRQAELFGTTHDPSEGLDWLQQVRDHRNPEFGQPLYQSCEDQLREVAQMCQWVLEREHWSRGSDQQVTWAHEGRVCPTAQVVLV